jgi:two-component system response regulator HydG
MEKVKLLVVTECGAIEDDFLKTCLADKSEISRVDKAGLVSNLPKNPPDIVCIPWDALERQDELYACIDLVKEWDDAVPIFVFSRVGGVKEAVAVMGRRVNTYFLSPWEKGEVGRAFEGALHLYHLTKKIFVAEQVIQGGISFEGMIGVSGKMRENFQVISAVAKSNATVLIMGESGTGKELVAKAIHRQSNRSRSRFVDLNCGAIPKDLLENELFGHERGAFTGADRRYEGSFEVADGGTLFLDEISEMDPLLQVKLLRVLQERSFSRIGGRDKINVDVRIVAATNRRLEEEVKKGAFREDLYYRLNVIPIYLPALRERREDVPLLAKHFLDKFCSKNSRIFLDFTQEALEALVNYDWPGNVRELENTIERVVVLNDDSTVKLKHMPPNLQKVERKVSWGEVRERQEKEVAQTLVPLEEMEREAIERAFKICQGNIALISKKLDVSQATLYRKIKKFGLIH